ncbi:transcriptional regulator [Campylobacter sp. BCW_6875]|uniref:S24 family peptidase n=1 Tax=unclassified Campylobacter TaxID=2593542 RepID=UPI0008740E73|nr:MULTISPECIES: S24 family peptidase [unclassified Campylobacter]OEW12129.1 transcriptional regulator [Campylobacter sp. BCW_6875]OEW38067.1 transcriptional regulator [Campylobacter sp. BCW_6460]
MDYKNIREIFDKIIEIHNLEKDEELAELLQVNFNTLKSWLQRKHIPYKDREKVYNALSINQINTNQKETNFYSIPKLNISASAGGGNELIGLEEYETGEMLELSKAFFKTIPKNVKAIRVDGYSMIPMLLPDSWVIFEEVHEYQGDGLYILNFDNQLMVKLLQLDPISKILDIISVNKDYKSYSIDLKDSQIELIIQGKVLRSII